MCRGRHSIVASPLRPNDSSATNAASRGRRSGAAPGQDRVPAVKVVGARPGQTAHRVAQSIWSASPHPAGPFSEPGNAHSPSDRGHHPVSTERQTVIVQRSRSDRTDRGAPVAIPVRASLEADIGVRSGQPRNAFAQQREATDVPVVLDRRDGGLQQHPDTIDHRFVLRCTGSSPLTCKGSGADRLSRARTITSLPAARHGHASVDFRTEAT